MSVIDKALTTETGMVRPWQTRFFETERTEPTGQIREGTLDRNVEWETRLTVGAFFWANQAQFADAKKSADRMLLQHLYRDVLSEFSYIETAIRGQDDESALQAIGRIKRTLGLSG